jgi:hypothetical protein
MKKFLISLLMASTMIVSANAAIFNGHLSTNPLPITGYTWSQFHKGYKPVDGVATVCTDGSMSIEDFKESLYNVNLDFIVMDRETLIKFFYSGVNPGVTGDGKDLPSDITTAVIADPFDTDFKSPFVVIMAFDKDGCEWGNATWEVDYAKKALDKVGIKHD